MNIGVLLTTIDPSAFAARFPDNGVNVARAIGVHRPGWRFETVPVKDGVFPPTPTAHDCYVITGGPSSVNDGDAWIRRLLEWLREAHAARVPVFGVCLGHQAIAAALGGEIGPNPGGWSLGVADTAFVPTPWADPFQRDVRLYSAHNEQVLRLPDQARVIGSGPGCKVAAFTVGDHFAATQHHPEMTPYFVGGLLVEMESRVGAGIVARAKRQVAGGTDGRLMCRWIARFLEWSDARRRGAAAVDEAPQPA